MPCNKHNQGISEQAKLLISRYGCPRKNTILLTLCPAGDTYIHKGKLRRRPEYDDGSRYWEHPEGREI